MSLIRCRLFGWALVAFVFITQPVFGQSHAKDPGPQTDTDAMAKQKQGIMEAVTQRQMRDLYHGWTTGEGIWSEDEQEQLRRALQGTNDTKRDMMTLVKAGMIPRDMVQRWLQQEGELENRVAEQAGEEETIARCRKLVAQIQAVAERTMKLRLAEARLKIKHDNPSLVGTASGGLLMDNPDKDEKK